MPRFWSCRVCRVAPFVLLVVAGGCRDRQPARDTTLAVDSSLATDLAMARQDAAAPLVFNDAPVSAGQQSDARVAPPRQPPAPAQAQATANRPTPRRTPAPAPRRSPAPTPQPDPAPASAPAPAGGVIGAGTRISMTMNGSVCAAKALVGDKYTATTTGTIAGSRGAEIPSGSTVVLEVASVDREDPIENSRITFRVRSVDVDGDAHPAAGVVTADAPLEPVRTQAASNSRTRVIGGAVAGAILGRILGGSSKATVIGGAVGAAAGTAAARRGATSDACIPHGAPLQTTLSRDIVLRPANSF